MALSFSQLLTLISDRFGKPLVGQKITSTDVKDVSNAIVNFVTGDGSSAPPYAKPNENTGKVPRLSAPYQYEDSALSHLDGLGGIRLDGAWQTSANGITKAELFQPSAHATNRYEASINLPKGAYGNVTLEVKVFALGQSAGLIRKVYTFDASTATGAANVTHNVQGDIVNKLYVGDPDWSGSSIAIPIHERTAGNVTKVYVVEVTVLGTTTYLAQLLTQTAILGTPSVTSKSTSLVNAVAAGATPTTQMSLTSDANGLKLVNDVTNPNASQFYGTNASGTRGWFDWALMKLAIMGATINRQTASYTLALSDAWGMVELNVASANTATVPPNSSVPFPILTQILLTQYGAGQTTIVAGAGVNLRSANGLKFANQFSGVTLVKIATDEWYIFGNTTT
ncbi:MAG: hypothetical protein LCH91_05440 [Bacteroidetes bacterium]|nr:hypothetical protein [Bacteroidota bacterium]